MPLEFIFLGVIVITMIMYFNLKCVKNWFVILGIVLVMIGYFIGEINVKNISINVTILIGLLLICSTLFIGLNRKNRAIAIVLSIGFSMLYLAVNFVSVDYNMFFTIIPICVTLYLSHFFVRSINSQIFTVLFAAIICDILNMFLMVEYIDYWALFSRNLIVCIVLCILPILMGWIIRKLFLKIKENKAKKLKNAE